LVPLRRLRRSWTNRRWRRSAHRILDAQARLKAAVAAALTQAGLAVTTKLKNLIVLRAVDRFTRSKALLCIHGEKTKVGLR